MNWALVRWLGEGGPQSVIVELAVRSYRRRFIQPLQTAHGRWRWREGLLLRLRDTAGRVGYGEVAPIPWFGSETVAESWACLTALGQKWHGEPVPDRLTATQFGLGSALADLNGELARATDPATAQICGLLPAGEAALAVAPQRLAQGHRTLKWKVGVYAPAAEMRWLGQLCQSLPEDVALRLDANGGWDGAVAARWLALCDRLNQFNQGARVEYLEQPLPPDQVGAMLALGRRFQTAIALDESVATLAQLRHCWAQGWRGAVVVKPAIAGAPQALRAFCRRHRPRLVFSSAFETGVGRRAALALAADCPSPLALGFGTQGTFDDDWDILTGADLWCRL